MSLQIAFFDVRVHNQFLTASKKMGTFHIKTYAISHHSILYNQLHPKEDCIGITDQNMQ